MITKWQLILQKYKLFAYAFVIIFYLVGLFGLLNPSTKPLFIALIPFSLVLSFVLMILFQYQLFTRVDAVVFISIFVFCFIVEAVGVATGDIFGNYHYGNGLGFKLFQTPLIIGLNWLFVAFMTASLISHLITNRVLIIVLSALSMVVYDVVLEQVAPIIDMWYWADGVVPIQNYLAWFFVALIVQTLIQFTTINLKNRMSLLLLFCQLAFFILLILKL